jgi:hypothetical protein
MRKSVILYVILSLILFSCSGNGTIKTNDSVTTTTKITLTSVRRAILKPLKIIDTSNFDFDKYLIGKSCIGSINIGMTIKEAEATGELSQLNKFEGKEYNYGTDGGGNNYLYKLNKEPFLAIIPGLFSDTIVFMIAIHPKLKTTNGLSPNMTVEDLLVKYPGNLFRLNLLNGGESTSDIKNRWDFIFNTPTNHQIGKYPDIDQESNAYNLKIRMDWIHVN